MSTLCPLCGSTETALVFSVSVDEASDYFMMAEGQHRIHDMRNILLQLWEKDTAVIRKCTACGFRFSVPYVAGTETFYHLAFHHMAYRQEKWEFEACCDFLKMKIMPGENLLEIGAGIGAFQDLLRETGLGVNVLCTEYSPYGIGELKRKGFPCLQGDFRQILPDNDYAGKFKCVLAFQVLEHLDDLAEVFSKIRTLLAPGGFFCVSVPNQSNIEFNETHDSTLDMPPNHIGCWCPSAFEAAATRFGFDLVKLETEPFRFIPALYRFSFLRFLHRAARKKYFCRRIEQMPRSRKRTLLKGFGVFLLMLRSLPLYLFHPQARTGNHLLAILQKPVIHTPTS